jgi:hypothetical protein
VRSPGDRFELLTRCVSDDRLTRTVDVLLDGRRVGWFISHYGAAGTDQFCFTVWTTHPTEMIAQFRSREGIDTALDHIRRALDRQERTAS